MELFNYLVSLLRRNKILIGLLLVCAVAFAGQNIDNLRLNGNKISSVNTNGDIELDPNGTGKIISTGPLHLPAQNSVRFEDTTGGEYVGLQAPGTVSSNVTFTLPSADATSGALLQTDGSGGMSFVNTITGNKRFSGSVGVNMDANSNGALRVQSLDNDVDAGLALYSADGTDNWRFGVQNNGFFYLSVSGLTTFPFMHDNAGKVGVGTGSPEAQMTVGGTQDIVQLSVRSNGTQTNNLIQTKDTGGTIVSKVEADGDAFFPRMVVGSIGTAPTNASVGLEVNGTTKALLLSRLDTTARDALTAANGMMIYNTSANEVQAYQNSTWGALGGGASGSSSGINILSASNYNAEEGVVSPWTESGSGTLDVDDTAANVANGTYAFSFDASAASDYATSGAITIPAGLYSQNCLLQFYAKGFDENITFQVHDGTSVVASEDVAAAYSTYTVVSINFVCPSSGTLEMRVSAGADAAIGYWDEIHLGSALNLTNVSQAAIVGTATQPGAANCSFSEGTSSGATDFDDIGTAGSCASAWTVTGALTAVGATSHQVTYANMPPGSYEILLVGRFIAGASQACIFRFSDGTNNFSHQVVTNGTANTIDSNVLVGHITYTDTASRTFKIQAADDAANSCIIQNNTASGTELKWVFKRFPTASELVYTPDVLAWRIEANISGANVSLGTSSVASLSEMTNAGLTLTPRAGSAAIGVTCATTNAAATPTTSASTCSAGNESIGGAFIIPRAGRYRVCFQFSHYLNQGGSAGSDSETNFTIVETPTNAQTINQSTGVKISSGVGYEGSTSAQEATFPHNLCGTLNFDSAGTKAVRLMYEQLVSGTVNSSLVYADASASVGARDIFMSVDPVDIQIPTPILVNSVVTSAKAVWAVESATVSSADAVSQESGDWINGNCTDATTGESTCNINSGVFSSTPTCVCTAVVSGVTTDNVCVVETQSSSQLLITVLAAGSKADRAFNLICHGPR